jgi:hypothetical protein
MIPASRDQLETYCLRKLGAPVLTINLSPEQLEDRIDEALQYFREYHQEGTQETFFKRKITASTMTFTGVPVGTFVQGETLTGGTSGAKAKFHDMSTTVVARMLVDSGTFVINEVITGGTSGATATLIGASPVTLGDLDNQYIPTTDAIMAVISAIPLGSTKFNLFDFRYQYMLNNIREISNMDLVGYYIKMQHISLINDLFNTQPTIDFSRKMNRITIDWNWKVALKIDDYIVFRCISILDPETYPKIYGDEFLIEYTTQLIKKQWGENLKKFGNVQLLGGVSLNGKEIYDEADAEIRALRESASKTYQLPPPFFVG